MGMTSTGSGNLPMHVDQLALVDDADELLGAGGDDLLARQRAAAALDHGHVRGDLVGAVDVDFHLAGLVQVDDADAVLFQALGGGHRLEATAASIFPLMWANSSMKKLAVEPVPTPMMPAGTYSIAARATACFNSSWVIIRFVFPDRA
jgi:hypothetical protein